MVRYFRQFRGFRIPEVFFSCGSKFLQVDAIDAVRHPPAGRCPEPVRVQAFAWHRRLSRARVIAR